MKPQPWQYDHMLTSTPDGNRLCRVFAPRWWQVWRWLWWILPVRSPRAKGWLTLTLTLGTIRVRYYVDTKLTRCLRWY